MVSQLFWGIDINGKKIFNILYTNGAHQANEVSHDVHFLISMNGRNAMAFIPTPGLAMATLFYQSNDATLAINRLYCAATEVPTETDLEEITEALYDLWVAQVMPASTNSWNLLGITARAMNEEEGLQHVDTNSYPINGGVSEAVQNPNQVSYTVTLNTGLVGRSARGRVYGIGLPINSQNGARLTDAGRASLQSVWELVQEGMVTAGHAIQVVSFIDGGVPRSEGRALPAVSVNVRFPLATQRRRLS